MWHVIKHSKTFRCKDRQTDTCYSYINDYYGHIERGRLWFWPWLTPGKRTFLVTMFRWYSATSRRSCWVRFSFSSSRRLSCSSCWNSRSSKCLLSTSNRSASFGEKQMKKNTHQNGYSLFNVKKKNLKANSLKYLFNYNIKQGYNMVTLSFWN